MIEKLGVKLYTLQETADLLGVTKATVKAMLRDGRLTSARIGTYGYISEHVIRAYLNGERKPTTGKEETK